MRDDSHQQFKDFLGLNDIKPIIRSDTTFS